MSDVRDAAALSRWVLLPLPLPWVQAAFGTQDLGPEQQEITL